MPLFTPLEFRPVYEACDTKVDTSQIIPKELDIFYRSEQEFLPEGKTFDQLTEKEKKELRNKYRFDPMKPGIYQGITGFSGSI